MARVIEVEDLRKTYRVRLQRSGIIGSLFDLVNPSYKEKEAVHGITFSVEQGETIGYLGPNGSGKSTTIKMLTGILVPTGGKVTVNGVEPSRQRRKNAAQIGAVFGQRSQLWWELSVRESFEMFRYIYSIPPHTFHRNLERMTELLALHDFLTIPVRQLSLGQRMRAEIACAFFHEPAIVYLDEPTIGLDVVAKKRIREFLHDINSERKTTIILTTHDIDDIEEVCRRLILLDAGQIIYDGELPEFVHRFGGERLLTVHFAEDVTRLSIRGGEVVAQEPRQARILFRNAETTATDLIRQLLDTYPVVDCQLQEPKVEEIIRTLYESGMSPQREGA